MTGSTGARGEKVTSKTPFYPAIQRRSSGSIKSILIHYMVVFFRFIQQCLSSQPVLPSMVPVASDSGRLRELPQIISAFTSEEFA